MKEKFALTIIIVSMIFGISCYGRSNHLSANASLSPGVSLAASDYYCPYMSKTFDTFVEDSYRDGGKKDKSEFYKWMDSAYINWRDKSIEDGTFPFSGAEKLTFNELLDRLNKSLVSLSVTEEKVKKEREILQWTHRYIKTVIPQFSLRRGYEFRNVVAYGERQCFLQSVLISGLFQKMGINSGVYMVYINNNKQETNNGHAVVVVKLSDGKDILVDASDPKPFMAHEGLFGKISTGYIYIRPEYDDLNDILSYRTSYDNKDINTASVMPLDIFFLRSQFYFYRGEWTDGGLHAKNMERTAEGLEKAKKYMEKSVKLCSQNPLAVYMEGRIYEELKEEDMAKKYFRDAGVLYSHDGWMPKLLKEKLRQ